MTIRRETFQRKVIRALEAYGYIWGAIAWMPSPSCPGECGTCRRAEFGDSAERVALNGSLEVNIDGVWERYS